MVDVRRIEQSEKALIDSCQDFRMWLIEYCDENKIPWEGAGFAGYSEKESSNTQMIFLIKFLPWFYQYCTRTKIPYWREIGFKGHLLRTKVAVKTDLELLEGGESRIAAFKRYFKSPEDATEPLLGFCCI